MLKMSDQRCADSDKSKRDIPSFIEPRPPLITNPFMRPRPQKGTNLMELFDEDSECEESEWVRVYLRLKPCNVKSNLYDVKSDRCLVTSMDTATAGHGRRTQHNVSKMYTFSHIFGPETTQKEIFENVVKHNLKRLPEGHNFTLLTYGASGSGKTYTLMGTVTSPGLVPRALEYVFKVVDAAQQPIYKPSDGEAEKLGYAEQEYELQFVKRMRQVSAPLRDRYRRMSVQLRNDITQSTFDLTNRTRYYVWVSFVEIYNEGIYDLLTPNDRSKATSKLRLREDSNGNAYVKGATQAFVRSGEEAYDIMVSGKHNLQVASTGVHARSSRSHCIFTITMLTESDNGVRTSCVRLCDLAGCERAQKTKNTGARMQESRSINTSLHVLEKCLHMLRQKQRQKVDSTLVPYRESKLTRLLGAGFSGGKGESVSIVVTLNPAPQYSNENKHVLQLAAVAKDIQVNHTFAESILEFSSASDTTTVSSAEEVMRLRSDNERLHFELFQSQIRNKELLESMEDKRQETVKRMSEMVNEARDITKQYYEAMMEMLETEMKEIKEKYESRLAELQSLVDMRKSSSEMGSPSPSLQKKDAQPLTEIALLKEKLTAEKLARVRAEEEVQHLRACLRKKRDENYVVIELSDSEDESEDEESDNENLEPIFKKEEINRSRLLQKSILSLSLTSDEVKPDDDNESLKDESDIIESVVEKSDATIKDDISQDETAKDSTYMTGVHEFTDNFENYAVIELSDSEDESEDEESDNENLEPIFKKEEINRSRLLQKSILSLSLTSDEVKPDDDNESLKDESDIIESVVEKSDATIKDDISQDETAKDSTYMTGVHEFTDNFGETFTNSCDYKDFKGDNTQKDVIELKNDSCDRNTLATGTYFIRNSDNSFDEKDITKENDANQINTDKNTLAKGTYFVRNSDKSFDEKDITKENDANQNNTDKNSLARGTYFVRNSDKSFDEKDITKGKDANQKNTDKNTLARGTYFIRNSDKSFDEEITKENDANQNNAKNRDNSKTSITRGTYFVTGSDKSMKNPFGNNSKTSTRETYFVKESTLSQNKSDNDKTNSFKVESVHVDKCSSNITKNAVKKMGELVIKNEKENTSIRSYESDISLAQFERLEKVTNMEKPKIDIARPSKDINIVKEKRIFFDNKPDEENKNMKNKTNFDDIDVPVDKNVSDVKKIQLNDDRSPSIVKDEGTKDFEANKIKILLGESFTRQPDMLSSVHKIILPKKHLSVDLFEGLDSSIIKPSENTDFNLTDVVENIGGSQIRDSKNVQSYYDSKSEMIEKLNISKVVVDSIESEVITDKQEKGNEINTNHTTDRAEKVDISVKDSATNELILEITRKSIEKMVLDQISDAKLIEKTSSFKDAPSIGEPAVDTPAVTVNDESQPEQQIKFNNTLDMFENIYKDITVPRATEFDLLISQELSSTHVSDVSKNEAKIESETAKYTSQELSSTHVNDISKNEAKIESETAKYNLRHKGNISKKEKDEHDETQREVQTELKPPRRNLRLRRRKDQDNENKSQESEPTKLKDIVNLQKEFSDVTLDIPAANKKVKDMQSPEKGSGEEENVPPMSGALSCPSKSVIRSRRKLFTPRADVLEESDEGTTGDSHERVRVPRPSYHKPRARRKL